MEVIKKIAIITLVCILFVLISIVEERQGKIEELRLKSEMTDSLITVLKNVRKIVDQQDSVIIQLTYQHEDDDALMEEEQPW